MIIERLDLKAYGNFTDVSLDFAAEAKRFHLIYGPNESGKSTSLRAITALLYGMPHLAEDTYLHPANRIRIGGLLRGENGTTLDCVRRRGKKNTLRDRDDNEVIDESILRDMLFGINEDTFKHRFGLSHQELVEGGAAILAGGGDLGEILFAAGAGISQLKDIRSQLDEAGDRLFMPRGKNSAVNQALREYDETKKRLREIQVPPSEYIQQQERLQAKRDEIAELEESLHHIAAELTTLRAFQKSIPLAPKWKALSASLDEVRDVPLLDHAFSEHRREIETEREVTIQLLDELETRRKTLSQRLQQIGDDSSIVTHAADIDALFHKLGAREEAKEHRTELQRRRTSINRKILETLRELGTEIPDGDTDSQADAIDGEVQRLRLTDASRSRINALAQQYAMLIQQRDQSREEVATLEEKLRDVERGITQCPMPADPDALTRAIDAVGNPDNLLTSFRQQTDDAQRALRTCEKICRRLVGFDGTPQRAARLNRPTESQIQQSTDQLRRADEQMHDAEATLETLVADREEINRRLSTQHVLGTLPTLDELQRARQTRNATVDDIARRLSEGTATTDHVSRLRREIQSADELVDLIRTHSESIHQRASDQSRLEYLEQQIGIQQSIIESIGEEAIAAQEAWQSLWRKIGVIADTPERMQRWIADHEQLIEAVNQWQEESKRQQETEDQIRAACRRLRQAIASIGTTVAASADPDIGPGLFDHDEAQEDLIAGYEDAISARVSLVDANAHQQQLHDRLAALKDELPKARSGLETKQKLVDQWNTDWAKATASLSESTDRSPETIAPLLRKIDSLCEMKKERDILATRIRSIGEDDLTFRSDVNRVAQAVGVGVPDDKDVTSLVKEIFDRLQREKSASDQRATLTNQIVETEKRIEEATLQRTRLNVGLRKLCEEALCDSIEQLSQVERRSLSRREMENLRNALEDQLRMLATTPEIKDFVESTLQQDAGVLEFEIEKLEEKQSALRDQLAQAQRDEGAFSRDLDQIDGGDKASELHQSLQFLVGHIQHRAEDYARMRVASMILRQAIDHYRRENQGPVLGYAEEIFRRLTCGEYRSLRVDVDAKGKPTLLGIRADEHGLDVPATAMSTGTADALYFALRLASLRHQLSHGHVIPLIVDDCLIQLDDQRATAALKALTDFSRQTQVILFTHHQHIIDLAGEHLGDDDVHFHRLDAVAV